MPDRRKTNSRPWRAWVRWDDEDLLDVRMCDLELRLPRTPLAARVKRLHGELEERGFRFRPHVWLSSEWFSPDGVPGIGLPFYLAHPRLERLEQKKMFEVEGSSLASCMRILRHEAGHAIDTAYRLHYRRRWREVFGSFAQRYPKYYSPRPNSRRYVVHLPGWYAQAHPAEDFAETFAVWFAPRSNWRQRYRNWPTALRKLEYVDSLMHEIREQRPLVRSRTHVEPLKRIRITLREHYERKRAVYSADVSTTLDRDLRHLFSSDHRYGDQPTAASFLRSMRREIRDTVSEWTGHHAYTIDEVLREIIDRCRTLRLRLARSRRDTRTHAIVMVTVQTMRSGRYEIAL